MAGKPQLSANDIQKGLAALGFEQLPQKSTSHTQWIHKSFRGKFRKVTVDAHHEPFSNDLVSSMYAQAGLTKREFYAMCSKGGIKAAKRDPIKWLKSLAGK
jgi:predicted RNA binding protein YcfA (HicA-like mRNA interferase family)